jgi:hypothetical protein
MSSALRHNTSVFGFIILLGALNSFGCSSDSSSSPEDTSDLGETATDSDVGTSTCTPQHPTQPLDGVSDSVRFSLDRSTTLDEHRFVPTAVDAEEFGYGGAALLTDYNDDELVDIFLFQRGGEGTPTCLYENTSSEGETSFSTATCFAELGPLAGGRLVGSGSGDSRVILYGEAGIFEFDVESQTAELLLQPSEVGIDCVPSSVITAPSDPEDLVVFFGPTNNLSTGPLEGLCQPHLVRRNDDGIWEAQPWLAGSYELNVLAAGMGDFNGDGFVDIGLAVDTFSTEMQRNTGSNPGGFFPGNATSGDEFSASLVPWVTGSNRAWGSFMGLNQFQFGSEVMTLLTDWGPPLVRSTSGSGDAIDDLGVELSGDPLPFSWSMIVADFNRDALDDFVLTRGSLAGVREEPGEESDKLFLQEEGGFSDQTATSGLKEHPPAVQNSPTPRHYSRAGTTTDFDRDGRLELLILPFEGRPLLYESNIPTHCMIDLAQLANSDPISELYGWSWVDSEGLEHPLRVDGHMRLGESEWVPVPAREGGVLRSPAGARVEYSCSPGERILPRAPDWITVQAEQLQLDLCTAGLQEVLVQSKTGNGGLVPVSPNPDGLVELALSDVATEIYAGGKYAFQCTLSEGCTRQ